jgi:hypothetical protein
MPASQKNWADSGLSYAFRALGAELSSLSMRLFGTAEGLTPAESEAAAMDTGELGRYYKADERSVELYEGLHYSEERGAWVARFVPTRPQKTKLPYSEATYAEVVDFARLLHKNQVKPSQSYKALVAFDARFDRSAAAINFPEP